MKIVLLVLMLFSCDKLKEMGQENFKKKVAPKTPKEAEIERWKEKLDLTEAEMKDLEEKIRKLVKKTKEAGALSHKIALSYMKVGNYELSTRYYAKAIEENLQGKTETISHEVHFFEGAIPFFEKVILYKELNDDILFEAGLAFANASRDRGWDKERRTIAVNIFKGLIIRDPKDQRYPFELALIYFDSSITDGLVDGVDPNGYNETDKAMKLISSVIGKEPNNIPAKFARANFLYRLGKPELAESDYLAIKSKLEEMKNSGIIKEKLEKNNSYQNVLKNLKKISEKK